MFGRNRPVVFDRDAYGRKQQPLPRWLLPLILGSAAGAGGLFAAQEKLLPPRLSFTASTQLKAAFEQAESERKRLAGELDAANRELTTVRATQAKLAGDLADTQQRAEGLRGQVGYLIGMLPPDPRAGAVEVRAARFARDAKGLAYDVVLTRNSGRGQPLAGVMTFAVAGNTARGSETTITLDPLPVSVGEFQSLSGVLPLPEGFAPRQSTINVRDRPDGRLLGMRVMLVR
jgi:hypothetical protein